MKSLSLLGLLISTTGFAQEISNPDFQTLTGARKIATSPQAGGAYQGEIQGILMQEAMLF